MNTDETRDPRPDPTQPAPGEQGSPERPDPAADLRPGGFLDQRLEESKDRARGDADTLRQGLAADLKTMREAMADPSHYASFPAPPPPADVPSWLVRHRHERYRPDTVLRFGLGRR
jgi:hypothetical protein